MKNYFYLLITVIVFSSCVNEKEEYNQVQIKNELKNDLNFKKYMEGEVQYLVTMDKIIQYESNIKTDNEMYEDFTDADLDYFNSIAKKYNLSRDHKDLKNLMYYNVIQKFDIEIIELEILLKELFKDYLTEFLSSNSTPSERSYYDEYLIQRLSSPCFDYCEAETSKYGNNIEDPEDRRGYKAAFETGCLKGCLN